MIISEKNLSVFINKLKENFEVFDIRNDKLPFKKYFLAPTQEIFSSKKLGGKINIKEHPKKFIIFGLNLIDLEALTQLDEIMKKPNEDFFYFQNRKQAIVIGLINKEIDSIPGGDIIFQQINKNQYKIWLATTKAKELIEKNKEFFEENQSEIQFSPLQSSKKMISKTEKTEFPTSQSDWSSTMRELLIDSELLANAIEWSRNHKIWDELAEKCLSCGICTYVCPLCNCFFTEDKIELDNKCSRCRKWDSCILPNFFRISGGYNFRPMLKQRYYNWFYHKFVRAYKEYGKSQCVGCGRCKKFCPAKIDIQEVLKIILRDFLKVTVIEANV